MDKPHNYGELESRMLALGTTGDLYSEVALETGLTRPAVKALALQVMYGPGFEGDLKTALIDHLKKLIAAGMIRKDAFTKVASDEAKAQMIADELNRPGGGK